MTPATPWLGIPKQPQRQDGLSDQLADLRLVAIHLGMYDALDFLQRAVAKTCGHDLDTSAVSGLGE